MKSCSYKIAAEQKARTTYDNILRMCDDPDVLDPHPVPPERTRGRTLIRDSVKRCRLVQGAS